MEDGELYTIDRVQIEELSNKAEALLQQAEDYKMEMQTFLDELSQQSDNMDIDETTVEKDLSHIVVLTDASDGEERVVSLSPIRIFAFEVSQLLESHSGLLPLPSLENSYFEK